jgi:hypothetical protein
LLFARRNGHVETVGSVDAVEQGLRDWVRAFIKDEPHYEKKILEGRLRLIFNTGATDIGVWRWLFGPLMERVVRWNAHSPFKPGMGLHDEGLRDLERWFQQLSPDYRSLVGTDVSGWDWSCWLPLARLAWRVVCAWYCLDESSEAAAIMWLCILVHFRKVVSFGDHLWAQETDRGWESGSFVTALLNTVMRVIVGHLV